MSSGSQRDSPVGLIDNSRIEVRLGSRLRECKKRHIGGSFARERACVVRVATTLRNSTMLKAWLHVQCR